MCSFISPQCRSDLYKVSCKVHKKVTKKFYSWKRKHWKVVQSSVCGSKKLFYYPSLCIHRPLTHQFLPTTSGIIARASGGGRLWRTLQTFPLQVKIMPVLQDCVLDEGDLKQKTIWKISICRWRGRAIQRKIYWGSHFYKRDKVSQECMNTKTLTDEKHQEGGSVAC